MTATPIPPAPPAPEAPLTSATPLPPAPDDAAPLRVLVVTESFLPQVNGVTASVCRMVEQLHAAGHQVAVVAPTGPARYAGAPVHRVRSLAMPGYPDFRVGAASRRRLRRLIAEVGPDVVHLASPVALGGVAVEAAADLGVPAVGVYQTDLPGFARRYRLAAISPVAARRVRRIHALCDLTLAPSSASLAQLDALGVPRVRLWPRGIDGERFTPRRRRDEVRRRLAPRGEVVIGYVGRLAREKGLEQLRGLDRRPGTRLVLVGDGPMRRRLEQLLPRAGFLGQRDGDELADLVAALDVFVHPGAEETFCQSVQEAAASGVPTVGVAAGGLLDRITHEVDGLRFTPGRTGELHDAVERLAADTELRQRLGAEARHRAASLSWQSVADALVGHYRAAIAATGRSPRARRDSTARIELPEPTARRRSHVLAG